MHRVVFFDLDGTLTDSAPGICAAICYVAGKKGFPRPTQEELLSCIGPHLPDKFAQMWHLSAQEGENLLDVFREYYNPTGIYESTVYPGIYDALDALRDAGCELRICSAKPTVMVEKVLKHFHLDGYFTRFSGAALHGAFPGKGAVLKEALQEREMRAVMIGDRRDDMLGAKEARLPGLGALWGYGSAEELIAAGADALLASPDEIPDAVAHIFR